MAHDENFTRFFCFLSLFAGAMLGVVIANSLLLLFMCWELVGLTSYLLIGFWYHKPGGGGGEEGVHDDAHRRRLFSAGDGVAVCADGHAAVLRQRRGLAGATGAGWIAGAPRGVGTGGGGAIGLLIFAGAAGKCGQVPLHVWLPDAMEGPTPVSALIHAATMVAAGVFLVARVYPLMAARDALAGGTTTALTVVTWVGASPRSLPR